MKRNASARLAALEQRLAPARDGWTLEARMNSWTLQGILHQLAAMERGEEPTPWPRIPLDLPPSEREQALEIMARWDESVARFPKEHPDLWEVIQRRPKTRGRRTSQEPP